MERQSEDGTFYESVGKDQWQMVTREAEDGTIYKKIGKDQWTPVDEALAYEEPEQEKSSMIGDAADYAKQKIFDAAEFIESYTSAPTRSAIYSAQKGENPIKAYYGQAGLDPSLAPSGGDIMREAGVHDYGTMPETVTKYGRVLPEHQYSPAEFAGVGVEMVADPTLLVPSKLVGKTVEGAGTVLKQAPKEALKTGEMVSNKLAKITPSLGHLLTGVPKGSIETYIKKFGDVEEVIKKYGGDVVQYADDIRKEMRNSISDTIYNMNEDIANAIMKAPSDSFASNEATIEALEQIRDGLNKTYYPGAIDEINQVINNVKKESSYGVKALDDIDESLKQSGSSLEEMLLKNGIEPDAIPPKTVFNAKQANEAKRYLQDLAKGTYLKNGQMFVVGKDAGKAAKQGGRYARRAELELAPETGRANVKLSKLHSAEKNMNKNLITPDKPEAALLAAGAKTNPRNARNLKRIGEITGYDALGEAEKLDAMRWFANPDLMPVDTTGKSAARMIGASIFGQAVGGPVWAAISMLFTSPKTLKAGIKSGVISKKALSSVIGKPLDLSVKGLDKLIKFSRTKEGMKALKYGSILSKDYMMTDEKIKGREKWANDGFNKLLKESAKYEKLNFEDKKTKRLLIEFSRAKKGSKIYNSLKKQIDAKLGGK